MRIFYKMTATTNVRVIIKMLSYEPIARFEYWWNDTFCGHFDVPHNNFARKFKEVVRTFGANRVSIDDGPKALTLLSQYQ